MKNPAFSEKLETIDALIRAGKGLEAAKHLRVIARRPIPRSKALAVARLARRANLNYLALRLLNPIVRAGKSAPASSVAERAEYAALLIRIGAADESLGILAGLTPTRAPEVLLYQAFAHVSRWEYPEAIPLLKAYLAHPDLTPYDRLVGGANLAAAFVHERDPSSAEPLLQQLLAATRKQHSYLHASLLNLATESAIERRDWEATERFIAQARAALKEAGGLEELFQLKWRSFVAMKRDGQLDAIAEARSRARQLRHWETLRDLDREQGIYTGDRELLLKVYFGTPHARYRETRVRPHLEALPSRYEWRMGSGKRRLPLVDLESGEIRLWKKVACMKVGQLLHRALAALGADFYRPLRVGSFHHVLYPKEYFNPETSPARVYFAVQSLRRWLSELELSFSVEQAHGAYQLAGSRGTLRVGAPDAAEPLLRGKLRPLLTAGKTSFTSGEVSSMLHLPLRSAQRLLARGVAEGVLTTQGYGASKGYRFR